MISVTSRERWLSRPVSYPVYRIQSFRPLNLVNRRNALVTVRAVANLGRRMSGREAGRGRETSGPRVTRHRTGKYRPEAGVVVAGGCTVGLDGSGPSRTIRDRISQRRTAGIMKRFLTARRVLRWKVEAAIVLIAVVSLGIHGRLAPSPPASWLPRAGVFAVWLFLALYGSAVAMAPILIIGPAIWIQGRQR